MAWHTAALIKLRGHQSLACPSSTTVSWDTVASVSDQSVPFVTLDDVPRRIHVDGSGPVTTEDLAWVREHWDTALGLQVLAALV